VRIIGDMTESGGTPLVAGGTALYYKALTEGLFKGPGSDPAIRARLRAEAQTDGVRELHRRLSEVDPAAALRILPGDLKRIERALEVYELTGSPISSFQTQFGSFRSDMRFMVLGLQIEREHAYERCDHRVGRMLADGLVEEARALFERYPVLGATAAQAVGYKEFYSHFRGECSLPEAVELVKLNTRHLARRQFMWFRKFTGVTWVPVQRGDNAASLYRRAKEQYPQFFDPAY
jgi:tRNA dimethylallyltransferase